jgi:hypothetical protein
LYFRLLIIEVSEIVIIFFFIFSCWLLFFEFIELTEVTKFIFLVFSLWGFRFLIRWLRSIVDWCLFLDLSESLIAIVLFCFFDMLLFFWFSFVKVTEIAEIVFFLLIVNSIIGFREVPKFFLVIVI